MLGSKAEAEDAVQDAYLRWYHVDAGSINSVEAWLVTTTTRLCVDRLRMRKPEKAAYVGPWLPESRVSAQDSAV